MSYESNARVSGGAAIGMDPMSGPASHRSIREMMDFLGAELEGLDKVSHDLQSRLEFFLEPDRPRINARDPDQPDQGGELSCRLQKLGRDIIGIRLRLAAMAERVN